MQPVPIFAMWCLLFQDVTLLHVLVSVLTAPHVTINKLTADISHMQKLYKTVQTVFYLLSRTFLLLPLCSRADTLQDFFLSFITINFNMKLCVFWGRDYFSFVNLYCKLLSSFFGWIWAQICHQTKLNVLIYPPSYGLNSTTTVVLG